MNNPLIICLEFDEFSEWLRQGLELFDFSPCEITKNIKPDQTYFFIKIPDKYQYMIKNNNKTYVLIDDIQGISLTSKEYTWDWKAKMVNLNEGWLPFEYHPEWLNIQVYYPISVKINNSPDAFENDKKTLDTINESDKVTAITEPTNDNANNELQTEKVPRKENKTGSRSIKKKNETSKKKNEHNDPKQMELLNDNKDGA